MLSLTRRFPLRPLSPSPIRVPRPAQRAFRPAPLLRLKEDAPRSPEEAEKAKQDHLKKQEQGQGQWQEGLASASESHVKADKQDVQDHDEHMEDLQRQTAAKSEKDHPAGKDSH